MQDLSDEEFSKIISQAMDELPDEYIQGLKNIVVTYEDDPSPQQRQELKLRGRQTLYGLYQGIPLTKRNAAYNLVAPDKITLFKNPIVSSSSNTGDVRAQTKHTLWHEIAHYYGLGHDEIEAIEARWKY